jgi:flagellar hook protein FlgE
MAISSIYPYIMGWSTPSPKKIENSFRNVADGRAVSAAETGSQGENASLNPLSSLEGLEMNMSGFAASASLFTDVSNASPGQGLPQMILYQRGYEANLKVIRTEDDMLKHTLDIIV